MFAIKDAAYNVAKTWNNISNKILQQCWNKLWFEENTIDEQIKDQDSTN